MMNQRAAFTRFGAWAFAVLALVTTVLGEHDQAAAYWAAACFWMVVAIDDERRS